MINLTSNNDTIVAISTPIGEAGIGIVRLSGKDAFKIADKIFLPVQKASSTNGKLSKAKTFSLHYGWIFDRKQKKEVRSQKEINLSSVVCPLSSEIIDEVIVSVMRAPRSYTKEDIVEINCHSGFVNLQKILDLVLKNGARLAEHGEFTRRAFLNGRIDLAQAEAVLDIIQAKTEESLKVGISQLKGGLSDKINQIREQLLNIFAHLEASIDFPEEDIDAFDGAKPRHKRRGSKAPLSINPEQTPGFGSTSLTIPSGSLSAHHPEHKARENHPEQGRRISPGCVERVDTRSINKIKKDLISIEKEIENLLKSSSEGRILREGVKVVIAGTPNVGKSSLLNAFLKEERVIVTPIPGTTRDAVEEVLNVGGIPIRLFDTAGIIEPRDLIEDKAVAKSRAMMEQADLILLMLDGSRKLSRKDGSFIKDLKDKNKLIVINKTDLAQKINLSNLKKLVANEKIVNPSTRQVKNNGSLRVDPTSSKPKTSRVEWVKISALKRTGIKELERAIVKKVLPFRIGADESIIVSNSRHINYLCKSLESLKKAKGIIDKGLTAEIISVEIKEAINNLDFILGRDVDVDLLDKIFSEFCIGK